MNAEFKLAAAGLVTGAQFSTCRTWRYALWRTWNQDDGHLMFVGLNPSTADETKDDPTIRRCIGFARRFGYGGVYMLNIFAFRSTNPKEMRLALDPVGPENDWFLRMYAAQAGRIVVAWGSHGKFLNRGAGVSQTLRRISHLYCLSVVRNGEPGHPLYLPNTAELMPYMAGA